MEKSKHEKIFLSSPHMSEEGFEMEFINEAFATNWIAPLGENVNKFETELAEKVGSAYGAALSSGTSAIHLALKAAGIKAGDRVFCPTFTFSATINPILYENAVPVFIDSDFETWNMSPARLEEAFEKYPDTKFVLVVHLYGLSADLDRIMEICKKYNAVLIEDAAESLGSFYKGKPTGSFGEYGIFSFNGNKIITTSGGGMLVSNNKERIEKVRFWSTQSRDTARHYQHSEVGYNYRMSNIVAGIGRGQLKVLDRRVAKKKYIFDYYKKELGELNGISFMPINEWDNPNCWLTCVMVKGSVTALDIMVELEKYNIETRPIWKPMHMQPLFEKNDVFGGDISKEIFESGLCLPSDTKLTDEQLDKIIGIIKGMW